MISILCVCYANICRSPAAAAILQHQAEKMGLKEHVFVDSCAISDGQIGAPPDKRMVAALKKLGMFLDGEAKVFKLAYFKQFDYILAADKRVLEVLSYRARSADERAKLFLLCDFSHPHWGREIPDPYSNEMGFDRVAQLIEECCQAFLDTLQKSV